MKCAVCGYRYKENENGKTESDGDEAFIQLINSFHRKTEEGSLDEVYLFACPSCGTARIQIW